MSHTHDGQTQKRLSFRELIDRGILEIGDGYRAKNDELGGEGPIFLRAGHVTPEKIDLTNAERFRLDRMGAVASKMAHPGDVVVTTKGWSTGRVAFINTNMPPLVYSPHLSYWRTRREDVLSSTFLRQWSRSRECQFQIDAIKLRIDIHPYLSLETQRDLRISIPPLKVQHAIGSILGSLDDKIDLNRRMNETLEAMAQALFKSWFVDFDPVRAKMEGRAPAGMDAETAAHFPDSLETSDLGQIPKKWATSTLKELTSKIGSGATPRGGDRAYVTNGTNFIRSQNVYDSEFVWEGLVRITDADADRLMGVAVKSEDVLLNITGASILRTCVVDPGALPARVNQHVCIVRAKDGIPAHFLHLHLLRPSTKRYLMGMDAGASRQAVTKAHIESVPLVIPSKPVFDAFRDITAPIYAAVTNNRKQIRTLSVLRDTLLPRLLSGELHIKDTEKLAEAAL